MNSNAWRSWLCPRAVPVCPGEAPIRPTGLPRAAPSAAGARPSRPRSSSRPGTPWLYSGVANSTPSAAAIACLERRDARRIARGFDVAVVERHLEQIEHLDRHTLGRQFDRRAQQRAVERAERRLPATPRMRRVWVMPPYTLPCLLLSWTSGSNGPTCFRQFLTTTTRMPTATGTRRSSALWNSPRPGS